MRFTQVINGTTQRRRNSLWIATASIVATAVSLTVTPTQADFLYTGSRNSGITRVDERTGNVVDVFADRADGFSDFRGMKLGPDGALYVSALYKGINQYGRWGVYRFDPDTGALLNTVVDDIVDHIAFGPNGNLYGVDSWGTDELLEFDRLTGERKRIILSTPGSYYGIGDFMFVGDQELFIVTDARKVAKYDISGEQIGPVTDLHELGLSNYRFDGMTLSPSGELLIAYNYRLRDTELPGGIMRFDPLTGIRIGTWIDDLPAFGAANGGQLGLAFGPEGDLYVGTQRAKAVLRFDTFSKARIGDYPTPGLAHSAEFIQFLPVPEPCGRLICVWGLAAMKLRQRRVQREL